MTNRNFILCSLKRWCIFKYFFFVSGNFEKEHDDVTIKMIFAIVQIIGFSNSICNPIVYAFLNENFKKNFLSAVCYCIVKEPFFPARRRRNLGMTVMQRTAVICWTENPVGAAKGEAFSDGNIEVRLCEQPEEERRLKWRPSPRRPEPRRTLR